MRRPARLYVRFATIACAALFGALFVAGSLWAALTAEQKKEVAEVKKELGKVQGLITKKETEEAEKILDTAESTLKKIVSDAKLPENDKSVLPLLKQIELRRAGIAKKKGGGAAGAAGGISFVKDIAPILTARCTGCHGDDNPRGGLNMSTFALLKAGGGMGPVAIVGNAAASRLCQKITATGRGKMPPNGDPLTKEQIDKIAAWIAQGCKYDGEDETTPLATLAAKPADNKPVEIAKATGNEKVSFVKDVAPFMSNLCVNCHGGGNPRAGFALDTFEKLMRGGMGGRVLIPGNTKDSRLWHLVGEQDPIKMPPGQALITEENWEALKTWIEEGCKFDGPDAKAPLRSLVPSEADLRAKEFAALSSEEMAKRRLERAESLWNRGLPNDTPQKLDTAEFYAFGNVSADRLKQVTDWAAEDVSTLKKTFGVNDAPLWKGKLALFVFKDHFSYAEFVQTNEDAQIPDESRGHGRVTRIGDEAYICIEDTGDQPGRDNGGIRVTLMEQLTAGLMARSKSTIPAWLSRGTGLVLASRIDPKGTKDFFFGMTSEASSLVKTISNPAELFADGTFSPASVGPVGYTLVNHMLQVGGEGSFGKFLNQMVNGSDLPTALKGVYSTDQAQLAGSFVQGLGSAKPGTTKKKK